jgi:hypothetical protein
VDPWQSPFFEDCLLVPLIEMHARRGKKATTSMDELYKPPPAVHPRSRTAHAEVAGTEATAGRRNAGACILRPVGVGKRASSSSSSSSSPSSVFVLSAYRLEVIWG